VQNQTPNANQISISTPTTQNGNTTSPAASTPVSPVQLNGDGNQNGLLTSNTTKMNGGTTTTSANGSGGGTGAVPVTPKSAMQPLIKIEHQQQPQQINCGDVIGERRMQQQQVNGTALMSGGGSR